MLYLPGPLVTSPPRLGRMVLPAPCSSPGLGSSALGFWKAPSFLIQVEATVPQSHALQACGRSDSLAGLWITFHVILLLSWKIVPSLLLTLISINLLIKGVVWPTPLVFSFFCNIDRLRIFQIFKFRFLFAEQFQLQIISFSHFISS